MLMDVDGLFFPHLWPLGLPQRESSSLELVQNCQMLPPEHSCISVHTTHTTSYFLTLFFGSSKQDLFRTYRTKMNEVNLWHLNGTKFPSSTVPRFHMISSGCSHGRVAEGKMRRLFLGPTPSGPSRSQRVYHHRISQDRGLNNEWWWTDVNHG